MSLSGIGSSAASPPPYELLPAAAPVAQPAMAQPGIVQPNGTSGEFSTGMPFLGAAAGDTIEEGAERLTLLLQLAAKADNSVANRIKAALAAIRTAIGAIGGNAARRQTLAAANTGLQSEIADRRQQLVQPTSDLDAAKAQLAADEKLDQSNPNNQKLVAQDNAVIADIQTRIDGLQQSIDLDQGQLDSNTAEIASLQTAFLAGFASIASAVIRQLSEEQQKDATQNQTVIAAVQGIYADLRDFLDNAEVQKVLLRVKQQQDDGKDVAARDATADATGRRAPQIQPAAKAASPQNNLAIASGTSPIEPNQADAPLPAAENQVVPATAPRSAQVPTLAEAPVDDPSAQDDELEREVAAEEAQRRQDDRVVTRAANAVEPAAAGQTPPTLRPRERPQDPAPDLNATANTSQKVAVQRSTLARDALELGIRDRISDTRVQQDDPMAAVTRRADELFAGLDRFVQRFAKPADAPLGARLTAANLENQENPGRRRLAV
jgi:hypothetical protein